MEFKITYSHTLSNSGKTGYEKVHYEFTEGEMKFSRTFIVSEYTIPGGKSTVPGRNILEQRKLNDENQHPGKIQWFQEAEKEAITDFENKKQQRQKEAAERPQKEAAAMAQAERQKSLRETKNKFWEAFMADTKNAAIVEKLFIGNVETYTGCSENDGYEYGIGGFDVLDNIPAAFGFNCDYQEELTEPNVINYYLNNKLVATLMAPNYGFLFKQDLVKVIRNVIVYEC